MNLLIHFVLFIVLCCCVGCAKRTVTQAGYSAEAVSHDSLAASAQTEIHRSFAADSAASVMTFDSITIVHIRDPGAQPMDMRNGCETVRTVIYGGSVASILTSAVADQHLTNFSTVSHSHDSSAKDEANEEVTEKDYGNLFLKGTFMIFALIVFILLMFKFGL